MAAVCVILIGGLLVPVINDAQDGQQATYANKGYRAEAVSADATYTWAASTGVTIGTDVIAPSGSTNGPQVILVCDTGFIKANFAGTLASFYEFDGSVGAGGNITAMTISVDADTKTVSITDITADTTIADLSFSYSEWCYIPSVSGEQVMYAPYSTAMDLYVQSEHDVYGVFRYGPTWAVSLKNDTATSNLNDPTYTLTMNETAVSGYNDLSKMSVIYSSASDYGVTVSGTLYGPEVMVIDRLATGVTDTGEQISPILAVIPALVIMGILIAILRAFVIRGRE